MRALIIWLAAILAAAPLPAAAAEPAAGAERYPAHPIVINIGGSRPAKLEGNALIAELLAEGLEERLGQPVTVAYRPGDGVASMLAPSLVAKSAPDGYNLLLNYHSVLINAALGKIDERSFSPVAQLTSKRWVLAVHPAVPARSLEELAAYSRRHPGRLTYTSYHVGALGHLIIEAFKMETGADLTHVPSGTISANAHAAAIDALVSGRVDVSAVQIDSAIPLLRAGKIRALAVTGSGRSTLAPELPTVEEMGLQGMDMTIWTGLWAPAGTPPAVVARLNAEAARVMDQPAVRQALLKEGVEVTAGSTEAFRRVIAADMARWKRAIAFAKIDVTAM